MKNHLSFNKLGSDTLLISWPDEINTQVIDEMQAYRNSILAIGKSIIGCYHTYNSLAVIFDEVIFNHSTLTGEIKTLSVKSTTRQKKIYAIPVCYDDSYAEDMEDFCKAKDLTSSEVIDLHTKPNYTVFFFGFMPGFMYLGGLDRRLTHPRKAKPKSSIRAGSVAIGGSQTGIYPMKSPGGWHVIGQSPIKLFHLQNDPPCQIVAGDQIEFRPISIKEFQSISESENYKLHSKVING